MVGKVGEYEAAKLLMLTSRGELEVSWPALDDERRDMDAHVKGAYPHIGFQLKVSTALDRRWKTPKFQIRFKVDRRRLREHPAFWYILASLDVDALGFRSPVFVVPSKVMHKIAGPRRLGRHVWFTFYGSLGEASHDQWRPYACPVRQLGNRVIEILRKMPRDLTVGPQPLDRLATEPGMIWVRPVRRRIQYESTRE